MLRSLALAVALLPLAGSAHAQPATCPKGQQRYQDACLPDHLVWYLICLNSTGNGKLQVKRVEANSKKQGLALDVAGTVDGNGGEKILGQETHGALKGGARVRINAPDESSAIRQLDELYNPRASDDCLIAAGIGAASHAAKRPSKVQHVASQPIQAPPLPPMEPARPLPPPPSVDGLSKAEAEFRDKNPAVRRELLQAEMRNVATEVARVANVSESNERWKLSRRIEMTGSNPTVSQKLPDSIVWGTVRAIVGMDLMGGSVPFYESLIAVGRTPDGEDIIAIQPMGAGEAHEIGRTSRREPTEITLAAAAARVELERLTKLYIERVLKNPENPR